MRDGRGEHATRVAEIGMIWLQAKACWQQVETERDEIKHVYYNFLTECDLTDTLISLI